MTRVRAGLGIYGPVVKSVWDCEGGGTWNKPCLLDGSWSGFIPMEGTEAGGGGGLGGRVCGSTTIGVAPKGRGWDPFIIGGVDEGPANGMVV